MPESTREEALEDLGSAHRRVRELEKQLTAAESRVTVLQLQLERAKEDVYAKQAAFDEASLTALADNAPQLTQLQAKMALLGLR